MNVLPGRLAWGCWRLDNDDVGKLVALLETCAEHQIEVIDTAPVYGYGSPFGVGHAERMLGRAFARRPDLRERFLIVTKAGLDLPVPYDSSPERLRSECETSREALGDAVIDLYLIHRPDLLTSWASLADTLDTLVAQGAVARVGVSNFTTAQVDALRTKLASPLVAHQVECSVLEISAIENGTLDQAQALGMASMAWSPLAGGRLFGATSDPQTARVRAILDRLAKEHAVSTTELALAFLLALPGVMPVIGSTNPERIALAAGARADLLSRREWYELFAAARGAPMP